MKSLIPVFFAFCAMAFFACNNESNENTTTDSSVVRNDSMNMTGADSSAAMATQAVATLTGTSPDTVVTGTARFDAAGGKVKLTLDITVPSKAGKEVAVHIHEHGDCGDKGNMAHGHWNPGNKQHGKWGSGNHHAGDIGNVKLDGQGKGTLTIETDLWTLGGDAMKNIVGKAVIVHSGVDDYTTQPTGNAGSRIGCGVIQ
jgi:Cu-Zn family superoxide dismutase